MAYRFQTESIKTSYLRFYFMKPSRYSSSGAVCLIAALLSFPVYAEDSNSLGYTKIANDGSELDASAKLGDGASEWACTRDNNTGLTWEIKTAGGLRDMKHTYTWYNTDPDINGGNAGFFGKNTCGGTLPAFKNRCNTAYYVAAINAAALCGYTDWRLPEHEELKPLVASAIPGNQTTVDPAYFPNTPSPFYWTLTAVAGIYLDTWYVNEGEKGKGGVCGGNMKEGTYSVRLVRGGK